MSWLFPGLRPADGRARTILGLPGWQVGLERALEQEGHGDQSDEHG
jgi:hypothetical protein